MRTPAIVSHRIAGRLRLRVPEKRADEAFFLTVAEELAMEEGIAQLETSATTASLLIEFDPAVVDIDALLAGFFELEAGGQQALVPMPPRAEGSVDGAEWLDEVKRFCSEPNQTQVAAALALIGYGLWQLGKGRRMGPGWFNAFWVAFSLLGIRK